MKIDKIFDRKIEQCLNDYSDTKDSVGTNLRNTIAHANTTEIIIPVLGMQGMGKSTLINGLLKENILPNDADETTCVPVEVKFGTEDCAKVHYFDNDKIEIVHTREELNNYVDNNYNPANNKHIANIELFRNVDFLKNGLVIVDLPGVGSLTKENEETTKRYVENLCSAIFVIPTVPTIRYKEAFFIKSLWSQFSKAIFVQNDWGESKCEMEESLDFNKKVLNKIATELHNPYDNEILVINAYNAIYGALHNDNSLVSSSNIDSLRKKILSMSDNWEYEKEKLIVSRILLSIDFALSVINKRISDKTKSQEEKKKDNERILKEFKNGTMNISVKIDEIKRFLRDKEDEIDSLARDKSRECASKIRASIFNTIDKGVYDGKLLSDAFEDIQEQETKDIFDEIINAFMNIKFTIEEKFNELQTIQLENDIKLSSESFDKESKIKWEKGVQIVLNCGGAVGGAAGSATLATFLWAGTAGPPGWFIAGVGLGIYGIVSLFGYGIKKVTQNSRADETKKQIHPVIDKIEKSIKETIISKYEDFQSSCIDTLNQILKDRNEEEKKMELTYNSAILEDNDIDYKAEIGFLQAKRKEFENV